MELTSRPARRRRRWKYAMIGLVVLIAASWAVVEFGIRIDRYRPMVEAKIAEFTGLPASIAELDLRLRPIPSVVATNASIGEGDLHLTAPQITLWPRILPLLRGNLIVESVDVLEPSLRVPETLTGAKARVTQVIDRIKSRPKRERRRETAVRLITLEQATIYQGSNQDYGLIADISISDVLEEQASIEFTGTVPYLGADARVRGGFTLDLPRGGAKGFNGSVTMDAIDVAAFSDAERLTGARIGGVFDIRTSGFDRFDIAGDGTLVLPTYAALADSFSIEANWKDGALTVEKGAWNSPGIQAEFTAAVDADRAVAVLVQKGILHEVGLDVLLSQNRDSGWEIQAPGGVVASATNLELVARAGAMYATRGTASIPGVTIVRDGKVALESVTGTIEIAENEFNIASLKSEQLELHGSVRPDLASGTAAFDLQGNAELNDALIALAVDSGPLKHIEGALILDHIRGTYDGSGSLPADLSVQASLTGGAFTVVRKDFEESVRDVIFGIEATAETLEGAVRGVSESLGEVGLKFQYALAKRVLAGSAQLPLQNAPALINEKLKGPESIGLALAGYGDSEIGFRVALPEEEQMPIVVELDRQGTPPLKFAFQVLRRPAGMSIGDMDVVAKFPGHALEDLTSDVVTLEGLVSLEFTRSESEATFAANVDLSEAVVRAGRLLEKPAGDKAAVGIGGTAHENDWVATALDIQVLGERLQGTRVDGSYVFDNIDIQVASIVPLVHIPTFSDALKMGSASGRITGSIHTAGPDVALEFHEVQLPVTEGLAMNRLDGGLRYVDGALTVRDIRWDGLNSTFVLNARQAGADWQGELTGAQLDINGFLSAWRKLFPPDSGKAEAAEAEMETTIADQPWVEGELRVALDAVLFEDATLEDLRARVVLDGSDVLIRDLVFVPGEGEVRGRLDILHALGKGRSVYDIDIELEAVSSSVMDDLREGEDRGVEGPVSGTVDLTVPEQPEGELPLADANGTVYLTGHDGTFGKLGLATKVLGVLKTTGVFSLRAPISRRGGLYYNDFETELSFDDGFMEIEQGRVDASSYTLTAKGAVDFDAQQSDVRVNVDLLQGVTGLAERVPLIGDVVGLATKPLDIRLLVTGSPTDIKVRQNLGQGERLTKQARDKDAPISIAAPDAARPTEEASGDAGGNSVDTPEVFRGLAAGKAPVDEG